MMLQPQEVEIDGKTFVLSKFPATVGREIALKYPTSVIPKLGDYATSEAMMLKLMSYVGVIIEGRDKPLMLSTRALVDNHCGEWETLVKLEWQMLQYNCSFFRDGRASGLSQGLAQILSRLITQMSMGSSAQSSQTEKQAPMS